MTRWQHSTLTEVYTAIRGYWRNWERNTAWLMREVVFQMINGNPNITGTKPGSPKEIYKMQDENNPGTDEAKRVSPEELEEARQRLIGLRDLKK